MSVPQGSAILKFVYHLTVGSVETIGQFVRAVSLPQLIQSQYLNIH